MEEIETQAYLLQFFQKHLRNIGAVDMQGNQKYWKF